MGRYDKITPMLYGANLHKGKIDLIANHKYFVFFIVNNTSNTDYINNELLKFIMAGCESFHFCGKYTPVWKSTLTNLHRQVYPNLKSRLDINTYPDLNEMAAVISECTNEKYFVPTDCYLIYDDDFLYKKVLYSISFGFAQGRKTCKECYRFYDDNACFGVSENDSYAEKCNGYIPAELIDEKDT